MESALCSGNFILEMLTVFIEQETVWWALEPPWTLWITENFFLYLESNFSRPARSLVAILTELTQVLCNLYKSSRSGNVGTV
jgi:hypothetical protein